MKERNIGCARYVLASQALFDRVRGSRSSGFGTSDHDRWREFAGGGKMKFIGCRCCFLV